MKKRYWQKLDPDCRLHSLRSVLHPLAPVAILVEPRWTKRNRKKHFKFSACSMQFQIYRSASREINSKRSFETWRIFSHRHCRQSEMSRFVLFVLSADTKALSLMILLPLQCQSNPNGLLTMKERPEIICWSTQEHTTLGWPRGECFLMLFERI